MFLLRTLLRRKPIRTMPIARSIAQGRIQISPMSLSSVPERVWTQVLERYLCGDWPPLTEEDLGRIPHYSRQGLFLMAGFGDDLERLHVLVDGDHRAIRVKLAWE